MEAKRKHYETPSISVVEVAYEGLVCGSFTAIWVLDGDDFGSDQDWGRDGYGDVKFFTEI